VRLPFVTACKVPESLDAVTTVHRRAEVEPRSVGVEPEAVDRIWSVVQSLYQSGLHPAIQLCLRRHGEVLVDRAIGHACGNGPDDGDRTAKVLATPSTPFNIFSASKAITAMIVHLLDERDLLHLDDPVCEYVPEFAAHDKHLITIRHVLGHRAGIPNLPPEAMDLDHLANPKEILRLLCDARPQSRAGRQLAYHAITGGFILAEIVRRVTGKNIEKVLDEEIRRPLGFRWLGYGVPRRDLQRVAVNYFTGPVQIPPFTTVMQRALGVPFHDVIELTNDPRFLLAVVPSGNIVATANELSRFYQLLLNRGELDGVRIFERRTVQRAISEQSYFEFDFSLALPFRYSLGFMLGGQWISLYGPDTEHTFGHIGFTNIISWADPDRQLAGTLMTSGKPLVYPQIYYLYDLMRQIGIACPKERRRRRRRTGGATPGGKATRHGMRGPKE
jgi:CubicO group peptidase (beta-lactamase class C family)